MILPFLRPRKKTAEVPDSKPIAINADATLVITHAEKCDRHGTGALLSKIFEHDEALLVRWNWRTKGSFLAEMLRK